MTQVIVHAGLPKTGTTSIQAMLDDEATALEKRGVSVIVRGNDTHHLRKTGVSNRFRNFGFLERYIYLRAARQFWTQALDLGCQTVLISDENLLGIRSRRMFDSAAPGRALIRARLLQKALPEGSELHFILYDRDPEALHKSAWNQRRRKGETLTYDDWVKKFPNIHAARRIIECMSEEFGQAVTVVKMEDEIATGRFLGEQLLIAAGVPDYPAPTKKYQENVGQS